MAERIKIDFEAGKSLDAILKTLKNVDSAAKNIEIDSSTIKQINDLTIKVEALSEEIDKIEKSTISTKQFEEFSARITSLIGGINDAFAEMKDKIQTLSLDKLTKNIGNALESAMTETNNITKNITNGFESAENTLKNIEKQGEITSVKIKSSAKEISTEFVSANEKRAESEKKVTEELKKQEDEYKKLDKESSKRRGRPTKEESDAKKLDKPIINLKLEEDADTKLKDRIASIVNSINETNPTVEVQVAFVSRYKTRKRTEVMEQISQQLDAAMTIPIKGKKQEEAFKNTITNIKQQFEEELKRDSLRLDFESNIKTLIKELPADIKTLSDAIGQIPLYADVHLNPAQVEEQLNTLQEKLNDFQITISNIKFSSDFLKNIDGAKSLIEEKEKLDKESDGVDKGTEEQIEQLDDFITKAKEVSKLAREIGKGLGTIPVDASFNKDQVQSALNSIMGLTLKISKLDVGQLTGMSVSGGGGGIYFQGGTGAGSSTGGGSGDEQSNNEFINKIDTLASSLLDPSIFKKNGEFGAKSKNAATEFLKEFNEVGNRNVGETLLDWVKATDKLGEGITKINNLKYLEDLQASMGKKNKIKTPEQIITEFAEKGFINKGGEFSKKITDKDKEDLLYSLVFYGIGKDAQTTLLSLLPKTIKDEPIKRETINEVSKLLNERAPLYMGLREAITIPTTPEKKVSTKRILDDNNVRTVTSDIFDEINRDIKLFAELADVKLADLSKTIQEEYEEAKNWKDVMNVGKNRAKQASNDEQKTNALASAVNKMTRLTPEQFKALNTPEVREKYPEIDKFLKTMEKMPEEWTRIQNRANTVIEEEIKTRLKHIETVNGNYVSTEKSDKAVSGLAGYLFKTYPDLKPRAGDVSWKTIQDQYGISSPVLKEIKSKYDDIKKGVKEGAKEGVKEGEKENKKEEKTPSKVRAKDIKEIAEAQKRTQKENEEKPVQVTRKEFENVDAMSGEIQRLVQRASTSLDFDKFKYKDSALSEVEQQMLTYTSKLAEIRKLQEKINEYKEKVKAESGEELTDEQVLAAVFPESPDSAKYALNTLKNYDKYYEEAKAIAEKIISPKFSQEKQEQNLSVSEGQFESLKTLTDKLKMTKTGGIKSGKDNDDLMRQIVNEIKTSAPVIGDLLSQINEEREAKSQMASEIEQIKSEMAKVEKDSQEYKNLESKRDELQAKISEPIKAEDSLSELTSAEVDALTSKINEERNQRRKLDDEIKEIKSNMSKLSKDSDEYKSLDVKRKGLQAQSDELTQDIRALSPQRDTLQQEFIYGLASQYKKVGNSAGEGYIEGVQDTKSEMQSAITNYIEDGIEAAMEAQDSHSPSRKYYQLGVWAIDGYCDAIEANLGRLKELASQIRITSDGAIEGSVENLEKLDKFKAEIASHGAVVMGGVSPYKTWKDPNGAIHGAGLTDLYSALPRTAKTKQIQSGTKQLQSFFQRFTETFSPQMFGDFQKPEVIKAYQELFEEVIKELGASAQDAKILKTRFVAFASKQNQDRKARLEELKGIELETNADKKTISKTKNVQNFKRLYEGFKENYIGAIGEEGIDDSKFSQFAKDMGYSDDAAKRIRESFDALYQRESGHINKLKEEALDAIAEERQAKEKANDEVFQQEQKNEEKLSETELENIEKAKKEEEKSAEEVKKTITKILETGKYKNNKLLTSYLEEGKGVLSRIKNGEDISIGQSYIQGAGDANNQLGNNTTYYKMLRRANKLAANYYTSPEIRKEALEIGDALRALPKDGEKARGELEKLNESIYDLEQRSDAFGKTFMGSVIERLKKANADFFARYFSIRDIIRYFKTFAQTVTEFDTALTEMRKVSDESTASLKEYQKATFDTASALGTTALQLQQTTADWLRLGESMKEASESAQVATTLLNVSEFENINEATTALVAMSQAYKDLPKTEIIDVLNNIGNNYAIATDQLATALQASSAALMTQGNDLYEAAALVTAGNQIIQDASKTGTGIRTIALRIAGEKLGKEELKKELEELGEEVDDWVVQTESKKRQIIMEYTRVASNNGQGVDILDPNGNLKDTYHILLEISKVYKEIQEEDKKNGTNRAQALVEELAGKVRSNIAASILMNPEILESVYTDAMNSAGSAAEENAKYLDSVVGKTQQLKNEWMEFQTSLMDSNLLKDLVDIAREFLSITNDLLKAMPALPAIIGAVALAMLGMNKQLFFAKGTLGVIPRLLMSGITLLKGFAGAEVEAGVGAEFASVAIGALNAVCTALASVAIMGAIYGIGKLIQRDEELARSAQEAKDAINTLHSELKSNIKTVNDVSEKYAKMAQSVSNLGKMNQGQGGLSNDEYQEFLDISNQLAEIFPQLQIGFTENGDAILNLNGSVTTIVSSLQNLVEVEKELKRNEMLEKAEDIYKQDRKDLEKYVEELENAQKNASEVRSALSGEESGVYSDILNRRTIAVRKEGMQEDFADAQRTQEIFSKAFDNWKEKLDEITVFDSLGTKTYDFNKLSEDDAEILKIYFSKLANEYENDAYKAENQIKVTNADFAKYMSMSLADSVTYSAKMSDKEKAIIDSLVTSVDLRNTDAETWDGVTAWFENGFIYAIEQIDSQELKDKMYDVLNDATLSDEDKAQAIKDILASLPEALGAMYDERHPLVLHFQAQLDEVNTHHETAIGSLLAGMTTQGSEDGQRMRGRAESYLSHLSNDQVNQLLNIHVEPNTINSLEDVYTLLDEIDKKSKAGKDGIAALLSQDTAVRKSDKVYLDSLNISKFEYNGAYYDSIEEAEKQRAKDIDAVNRQRRASLDVYDNELANMSFIPENAKKNLRDKKIRELNDEAQTVIDEINEKVIREIEPIDVLTWGDIRNDLVGMAQAGKLDEKTIKEYKHFDEIIKALGLDADLTDEDIKALIEDINKFATQNAVDYLSDFQTEIAKLDDAYQKFKKNKFIDANTLSQLQDAFGDLDSYQEFEKAVLSGETNLQEYFDNIVTEYAKEEGALAELTEENKNWVTQQLIASGVTEESAKKSVNAALKRKETIENEVAATIESIQTRALEEKAIDKQIASTEDLDNVTIEQISALVEAQKAMDGETWALDKATQGMIVFAVKKQLAKEMDLRNPDDIEYLKQLIALAELGGIRVDALKKRVQLQEDAAAATESAKKALDDFKKGVGATGNAIADESRRKGLEAAYEMAQAYEEGVNDPNNTGFKDAVAQTFKEMDDAFSEYDYKSVVDLDYGGDVEANKKAAEEALQKAKETLDKILALYDAELEAGVISFKEYVDKSRAIIEQYYNEGRIKASDYYNYIASLYEKQVSEYDKVISAVQRRIKEEVEALEKQKETIEESYNLQIEEIQKKIDVLQEENDEIDKNLALSKAQYQLARQQHQRTKLMYSESRGFYYEADLQGIAEAQENVRKAQLDKTVSELQRKITQLQESMKKETSEIDEQIKSLNELSEAWGEVSSTLEREIEDQRAIEIIGQNWEETILSERQKTLEDFTKAYVDLQHKQRDAAKEAREAELAEYNKENGSSSSGGQNNKNYYPDDSGTVKYVTKYVYDGKEYDTLDEATTAQSKAAGEWLKKAQELKENPPKGMPTAERIKQIAYYERQAQKEAEKEITQKKVRAKFAGTDHAQPGETLVGELGSEIVLHKNGTASIVDSPTLMNMKGGEKVFNAEETEKILNSKYVPLKKFNPKKFAMLHAFANGTSSPMQSMIAAQAVGIANGLNKGLIATSSTGGQTINQTFNVSLPNITDSSKASELFKEFEQLQRKATQFFN